MMDRAEERKTFDRRRFDRLLARAGGHPGRVKLRYALDTFKPEYAVLRSDLERRFRELVLAAGLPRPATNIFVAGCELDVYWEAEGFAVELDVYATHGSRLSFEEDRERADDLLLAGIELIRVTDVRLNREPRETIAASPPILNAAAAPAARADRSRKVEPCPTGTTPPRASGSSRRPAT
jgi:hypothetical protein